MVTGCYGMVVAGSGSVADWPLTSDLGPLGALPTVPSMARGFVDVTLSGWGLDGLIRRE